MPSTKLMKIEETWHRLFFPKNDKQNKIWTWLESCVISHNQSILKDEWNLVWVTKHWKHYSVCKDDCLQSWHDIQGWMSFIMHD